MIGIGIPISQARTPFMGKLQLFRCCGNAAASGAVPSDAAGA